MKLRKFTLGLSVCAAAFFAAAWPAHAEPVSTAIAAWSAFAAAHAVAAFAIRTLVVTGLSMLAQSLQSKPDPSLTGVKTQTTTGGATPHTFILGWFATSGQLIAPLMSYGTEGKTPNAYLVYPIALGCLPGQQLSRLIVDDNFADIGTTEENIGGSTVLGFPLLGDYAGNAWIRYHDGSQTEADALLIQKFADYPDRPWSADMIGHGIPYAVLVFKFNTELWSGEPRVRFEMDGIPLYDPRYDTTVGGDGGQRHNDTATWVTTRNPAVMIYNIHRGIPMPDGSIWGGEAEADDLPLDNWFTAMNACDAEVMVDGVAEPAYTAGIEVSVNVQPADVMEALATACNAQQVEIGGVWKIRIGGPGLPVYFFTDDDVLVDHDQNHDMFPSLDNLHNAVQATYPLPAALWDTTDAPPIYNALWEGEDGGRRLPASLNLNACHRTSQTERVMTAVINEERRFRRHGLSLGPYASILEPLDSSTWTSAKEGYTNKVFEVSGATEGMTSLNMALSFRERDAGDYTPPDVYLPSPVIVPGSRLPVAQEVPGFTFFGTSIPDGNGNARRAAVGFGWDPDELPDVTGVMYEVRLTPSLADVVGSSTDNVAAGGVVVAEGIVGSTDYQGRAKLVATGRRTNWTSWVTATTPNVRLAEADLPTEVVNLINTSALDLVKLRLDLTTFKQIQTGLNYTGDGRSTQLVSIQAENKAVDALYRFNLMAALNADASAVILRTDYVQIGGGRTLSGFVDTVDTKVGDLESSVTFLGEAVDGLKAHAMLKVQAGRYISGIYADADDTVGSSTVGLFASKTFIGDTSDPDNPIQVFLYSGGVFTFNGDIRLHGSAVIDDSLTIHGIAVNTFIVPAEAETVTAFHGDGTTIYTLCATTVTLAVAGIIKVSGALIQGFPTGDDNWNLWVYIDGSLTGLTSYVQGDWTQVAVPIATRRTGVAAGAHTVEIKWKGGASVENVAATIFVEGIQKVA